MKQNAPKKNKTKTKPTPLRLDPDVKAEIAKLAERSEYPEAIIMRQILKAGTRALAEEGYRLPGPLKFKVIHETDNPVKNAA